MKALIDGAASRSFLGPRGMELMDKLGLETTVQRRIVQVANRQVELVSDEVLLPIELDGTARLMRVRVLPSLPVALALGLDFLRSIELQVFKVS